MQSAILPVTICPSRRKAIGCQPNPNPTTTPVNFVSCSTIAKTDYAANAGSNVWTGTGPYQSCVINTLYPPFASPKYPNCGSLEPSDSGWDNPTIPGQKENGISGHRTEVKPASIIDGLANTLFAAEKYLNPLNYTTGTDGGDEYSEYIGCCPDVNRWVPGFTSPFNLANPTFTNQSQTMPMQDTVGYTSIELFGSAHATGFNAVFCDGSVKAISFQINPTLWACFGVRNDQVAHDDLP